MLKKLNEKCDRAMMTFVEYGPLICVFGIVGVLIFIGLAIIVTPASKPGGIFLAPDKWECSNTRDYSYTVMMPVGPNNTLVPMQQYDRQCVQWSKKG